MMVRDLWRAITDVYKQTSNLVAARMLRAKIDAAFPAPTAEDLATTDVTCVVCLHDVSPGVAGGAKRLACGHVFHVPCLLMWWERQQSCPTCRADIHVMMTKAEEARRAALRAGLRDAAREIAALRHAGGRPAAAAGGAAVGAAAAREAEARAAREVRLAPQPRTTPAAGAAEADAAEVGGSAGAETPSALRSRRSRHFTGASDEATAAAGVGLTAAAISASRSPRQRRPAGRTPVASLPPHNDEASTVSPATRLRHSSMSPHGVAAADVFLSPTTTGGDAWTQAQLPHAAAVVAATAGGDDASAALAQAIDSLRAQLLQLQIAQGQIEAAAAAEERAAHLQLQERAVQLQLQFSPHGPLQPLPGAPPPPPPAVSFAALWGVNPSFASPQYGLGPVPPMYFDNVAHYHTPVGVAPRPGSTPGEQRPGVDAMGNPPQQAPWMAALPLAGAADAPVAAAVSSAAAMAGPPPYYYGPAASHMYGGMVYAPPHWTTPPHHLHNAMLQHQHQVQQQYAAAYAYEQEQRHYWATAHTAERRRQSELMQRSAEAQHANSAQRQLPCGIVEGSSAQPAETAAAINSADTQ